MSTDDSNARENGRPKFDDVASLFSDIVPRPGTPVRPRPAALGPPSLPDPSGPAILSPPPRFATPVLAPQQAEWPGPSRPAAVAPASTPLDMAVAEPGLPPVERTPPRPLPTRGDDRVERGRKSRSKAGGASVPWPDAFDPKPNYRRKPSSRYRAWLLLVPFLAVAAIGVFLLNPQTIRAFVETHFPHLQSPATDPVRSLLPAPFRDDPASTVPTPAPTVPSAPPAAAPSTEPAPAPAPAPTQANTPVPVVPQAATNSPETPADAPPPAAPSPPAASQPLPAPAIESPAAVDAPAPQTPALIPAAPSAASSALSHVTVHYRRSETDGRRVAAQVERLAGKVDLRSGTSAYRSPTVVYYTPLDRDAATAVARILGDPWSIRAGPGRPTPGSLDLWLP